jgi:MPBQ/MSBQ methyltransferase
MRLEDASLTNFVGVSAIVVGGSWLCYKLLSRPSRPFESTQTVGDEYNKWTRDGILEHYWGEHIHLGFYADRSWFRRDACFLAQFLLNTWAGARSKLFKDTKLEFIHQLMSWSGVSSLPESEHIRVLDVGCGIGGTSRAIAGSKRQWTVTGISISPEQVERASSLAIDQNIMNVDFRCCDAMSMPFPDNAFDVVWSCESAEHMPDKEGFLKECLRVLKPGGRLVLATWCQRDDTEVPFTDNEARALDFLYKEWCHPKFASLEAYAAMSQAAGLGEVRSTDWTEETLPAWRHSIFVGMWSPWAVIIRPSCWWSTIREIVTLERMHCAFRDGLMRYGIVTGTKL